MSRLSKNDYVSVWISISKCSSLHVKKYTCFFFPSRIDSIFIVGWLLNHNSTARIQIVLCICLFFWLKKTNKMEWSAHRGITTYRHRLHVDNHSSEGVSLRSARRFSYISPIEFPSKIEVRISTRESAYYQKLLFIFILIIMMKKKNRLLIHRTYFKYN